MGNTTSRWAALLVLVGLGCGDGSVRPGSDRDGDGGGDGATEDGASDGSAGDGTPTGDGAETDGSAGDGTPTGDGSPAPGDDAGIPEGLVPGIVAVGYNGLTVTSRDDGQSWGERAVLQPVTQVSPGNFNPDDMAMLRGLAYGNGLWVAVGWKLVHSTDGVHWTDDDAIDAHLNGIGCTIMESVAFGNGIFVGFCGQKAFRSEDGKQWEYVEELPVAGPHMDVSFGEGKFVVGNSRANEQNWEVSYQSSDGSDWQRLDGVVQVRVCGGAIKAAADCGTPAEWIHDDLWLSADWQGIISRRVGDSGGFTRVYEDPEMSQPAAFAAGYVAP